MGACLRSTSLFLAGLLFFPLLATAETTRPAAEFRVTIQRDAEVKTATFGKLSVDGKVICHTLELPDRDNKQNVSRTPAGTYSADLRYDGPKGWRIQLRDVPGRTLVQIHLGSFPNQTKGCILVGLTRDEKEPAVYKNSEAIATLRRAFYGSEKPDHTQDKTITVVVSDTKQ